MREKLQRRQKTHDKRGWNITILRSLAGTTLTAGLLLSSYSTKSYAQNEGSASNVMPYISSLSPSQGPVGAEVKIHGSGFTAHDNRVKFGNMGTENNPKQHNLSSPDGRTLVFRVPESNYLSCWYAQPACAAPVMMTAPGIYLVSVINGMGTSNSVKFEVLGSEPVNSDPVVINSLTPNRGPVGTKVVITGSGFAAGRSGNQINIARGSLLAGSPDGRHIEFILPPSLTPCNYFDGFCTQTVLYTSPGTYAVSVQTRAGKSTTLPFEVTTAPSPLGRPCHTVPPGLKPMDGFGASWEISLPERRLLISGICRDITTTVTVGSGDEQGDESRNYNGFTYALGYGYTWDGKAWKSFNLACAGQDKTKVGGYWCKGKAQGDIAADAPWLVGYTCTWDGSRWHCGCRSESCAAGTSAWQLQGINR